MNEIVGFIVGIEKYDQPNWSVAGPCPNALSMVHQILAMGARPENIHVFTDPWENGEEFAALKLQLQDLKAKGIAIRGTTFHEIDDGFRNLLRNRKARSRLFFYWSGHGFMDRERQRILVCQDYRGDTHVNRIFNASHRFLHLSSTRYCVFSEQIRVADVCAPHIEGLKFAQDEEPLDPPLSVRFIELFATPDG
jgi:hypothetical protein